MHVQGKRVLITGGSSGIGLATAEALLSKGASVVIVGRRAAVVERALARLRVIGHADGVEADITTEAGRMRALAEAQSRMGGLQVLIHSAGGVRAGRLEETPEDDIRKMVEVNLLAPILLSRLALPMLRASSSGGMIVNISSGIALVGVPFYATYAGVKSGIAHFGEAMRRELKGEGVHVLTVYPGATDTPMMSSSDAGPELGFVREPASTVADAIVKGIEQDAMQVIRGGEVRAAMIAQNRTDPAALDQRFAALKPKLLQAVKRHVAL
ncbi:SDR family NAD(P)-dependent oxidoreductase [Cupriavidus gilardii]|uniref:SDR family oxidoreductase n=1 Tax=Cupriavidus gilardii TaxID=82541 RepID=A0A849BIH4_9BURK|nr:SDR family oxidoreductase [Cupriavidus gilardii]KAB0593870.1 SDR family oxidoreductase [Cupriavidus gilardii]MCT9016710.1 SDR family oxidoreductase [Cupriavidus gilardii]MCT9056300.1 SDR family oxidoreductase [Cupriavidus gilardii]NNH13573.1 SDR family oxidoreductase [Cupriavidus gilardii]WNG68657.1 SDR family oxidoreductase [Cupriavidus gilardii]